MMVNVTLDWMGGEVNARRIPPPKFQHTDKAGRFWQRIGVTSNGDPVYCDANYGKRGYIAIEDKWWAFRLTDIS